MTSVLHVATTGSDTADGSEDSPFRTINRAAAVAQPGDTVVVHAGEYREWVTPRRGGLSDRRRITYEAAAGEHVVIKGSERVTGWEPVGGTVWKVVVPNSLFGAFNPFAEEIDGDWIVYAEQTTPKKHLGDVYLNGRELLRGAEPGGGLGSAAADRGPRRLDRDDRPRSATPSRPATSGTPRWAPTRRRSGRTSRAPTRTRSSSRSTCAAPSSTRPSTTSTTSPCAASSWRTPPCPWTPPTADQPGLIGPNWAKGWIIEDNVIHDAKCSAISLGKEASTGPQLRDRCAATSPATSTSSSRCSPPARSAGTGSTSARTSSAATPSTTAARTASSATSAACSRRSRTTTSTTSRSSASSTATRSAASSCTPPSTSSSATTASTTARSAPGWTGRRRAPASRATSSTPTTATSSSR